MLAKEVVAMMGIVHQKERAHVDSKHKINNVWLLLSFGVSVGPDKVGVYISLFVCSVFGS